MDLSMAQTTLVVLLLSGLVTLLSASINRKYYYVDKPLKWAEAQSYCRLRFTDLATIENDDDNKKLLTSAPTFEVDTHAWIGLYDDYSIWKWSMQDENFYGNGEADFRSWRSKQPNNLHDDQHCVRFSDGEWNDYICRTHHPFICTAANGSYFLIAEPSTWTAAQTYCRTHYRDLASIRNRDENNKVNRIMKAGNAKTSWIGLYNDPWHPWSDNSTSKFTNWKDGYPSGRISRLCTAVSSTSGKWLNSDCGNKLPFFCYNAIKSKLIFKMSIHSAADMNNKDVQHQFTQQLHALLESQGVTNVTMRILREDKPPPTSNSPPSACP